MTSVGAEIGAELLISARTVDWHLRKGVERLPDASHWVHHDEAGRVTQLLTEFFGPATR